MILTQHYLACLSHASYLIGDETTGRAVVVDPRRDVGVYTEEAAERGLRIERVIETHVHADFLSGHLELADKTGAVVSYGAGAEVDFPIEPLGDLARSRSASAESSVARCAASSPRVALPASRKYRGRAPAAVTFAAARQMDIQASPVVKGIFWLRAIPALARGEPFRPQGSRSIVAETLDHGWGVLAEVPDREIVVGACTQPWHEHVTFRPLPPEEFAAFSEPGYVKIVWTLAAEPAGPGESWFVTRTRVLATDAESREKFRWYWAPMSAGIILIRYAGLPLVRKQAQRQARQADEATRRRSPASTTRSAS